MTPESKKPPMSVQDAIAYILGLLDEIQRMGSNDSEIPTIDGILERLRSGGIQPEVAAQMVFDIRQGKQDYH